MVFLVSIFTSICLIDDEDYEDYQHINFINGSKIAAILDELLYVVPVNPEGSYMSISRFPYANWRIACNAIDANFSCLIQAEKLQVVIYQRNIVSELRN